MATPNRQRFWQRHIKQWQSSGLNQAQYCKQHNLKESALSYHKCRQQLSNHDICAISPVKKIGFIQLPAPELLPLPAPLTLHFQGDLSLSGITSSNVSLVKQLAEALS